MAISIVFNTNIPLQNPELKKNNLLCLAQVPYSQFSQILSQFKDPNIIKYIYIDFKVNFRNSCGSLRLFSYLKSNSAFMAFPSNFYSFQCLTFFIGFAKSCLNTHKIEIAKKKIYIRILLIGQTKFALLNIFLQFLVSPLLNSIFYCCIKQIVEDLMLEMGCLE